MMISNKIKIVFIVSFLFATSIALGQVDEHEDFQKEAEEHFEKTINNLGIPGFSVVVVQGNKTILNAGYGYADIENSLIANSNTNYYIASATKSFTALMAVMLDEEGILSLDDPLNKYFPDLEIDSTLKLTNIKIRDLLTHTSGLENDPIDWRVAYSGDHDLSTLLGLMSYSKPNEVGNGNYQYTNIGYNIYALILKKITGKSWQNWMQEKIFDPAGMNHTTAFVSRAEKEKWLMARPHIMIDSIRRITLEKKDNTMHAAGGVLITPADMAKWLKIQVGKGNLDGKQIFPETIMLSTQQELVNIGESERLFQPTGYGFGWLHGDYAENKVIHHFGGFAGFSTHVSFMPEQQIGVSVIVNEALAGNKLMHLIATFIYDYLLEKKEWDDYNKEINAFMENLNQARKMIGDRLAEGNNRPSTLSLPLPNYSGVYESDEYGVMNVQETHSGLKISIGNLQCVSTPYKNKESIRVELIPGSGQIVQFFIEQKQISKLKYDGIDFKKIK